MQAFSPDSAGALAGPRWLRAARKAAAEQFAASQLPSDSLEEWRYSCIDALELDRFSPAPAPSSRRGGGADDSELVSKLVAAAGRGATVIETRDGHVAQVHGSDRSVAVERLSAPDAKRGAMGDIATAADPFAVLNLAFAPGPIRVRVSAGKIARPVVIVHWSDADETAIFPRLLVELGQGAEAAVIEIAAGPAAALVIPVTELDVADRARLSYAHVQLLGPDAWQLGIQASRVGRDASLVSAAIAFGGDYARMRTDSSLGGVGASSRLLALYFASGTQMHDFRTVQHHRAPKTQSDLLYKGVVANTARSVYSGLIRVEKGAAGTNAMQTNRNLVLHEGAHADSVPNLEIEENDVRCSHASAVGPIDGDQHFYLESRGVPPAVADRLITLGFLDEVLEQLPLESLAAPLRDSLAVKVAAAQAAEAP